MKKIIIIGNGISGITAARHIRKQSNCEITVISGETDFFFSRTALMYIYMGHMKFEQTKPYEDNFWETNEIHLVRDIVIGINADERTVSLESGTSMKFDDLIISVGSKPNKFGWPGQDLNGVQGLYSYQDLCNMELYTRDVSGAVIVGGGLIGIEMAEMLRSKQIPVTFLVRESSFWNNVLPPEESDMINRHIAEHDVDLRLSTELNEIIGDTNGRAQRVITSKGEEIECGFVGLTAGVRPNIGFLEQSDIETNRGVLVNEYFETNIPGVYAIGDCAEFHKPQPGRKAIEQVWYTGRMQGETLAHTICGTKTAYRPGNWFNSAKFFDIEYQVYGDVKNKYTEDEEHLYWEHPSGKQAVRLVYEAGSQKLRGVNLMGIRYRHEVCDHWMKKGYTIRQVLMQLKKANFDPEFHTEYEQEIINIYNQKHKENPLKSFEKHNVFSFISAHK